MPQFGQELLFLGGYNGPRTVHEVIAQLASRMSRWDDRLFRKSIFGEADEIELKFMNRLKSHVHFSKLKFVTISYIIFVA